MQAPNAQPIAHPSIGWGHMQLRASAWMVGVALSVVVTLVLGAPPQVAAQGVDDLCEGFSDTCHGQCQAALAQGCFDNPDTRQCGKREEQWSHHDCPDTPPWVPQDCPCEDHFGWSETSLAIQGCQDNLSGGLSLSVRRLPTGLFVVLQTVVEAGGNLACRGLTSAGYVGTQNGLSEEEFEACNDSLRRIAANDGKTCLPTP